jgi:hypothetical protein
MTFCREAKLSVTTSGSGPSFFSPAPLETLPDILLAELERRFGVHATAFSSLSRSQATAMSEA